MPASPLYEVVPRHTMFQIGRDLLPTQANNPLVGIVKREGVLERVGGDPALPAPNPPMRILLHCCLRNLGDQAFTLEVRQSENNNSDGLDPDNADVGPLTPDAYAAMPIRAEATDIAGGDILVAAGGAAVFLIEWDETHDSYLRFEAPPVASQAAVAATGNVDLTGLPTAGQQVVISDGINPAITYQFGTGTDTATLQHVAIGASAAITIASFITLVNTPTASAIVGFTASAGAGDSMDLVQDAAGAAGNVLITENAANTTATGMAGGADPVDLKQPFGELTLSHYNGTLVIRAREGVI